MPWSDWLNIWSQTSYLVIWADRGDPGEQGCRGWDVGQAEASEMAHFEPCFVTALHGSEVSIFSLLLASDGASTQHMAQALGFNMTSVLIVLQAVKSLLH